MLKSQSSIHLNRGETYTARYNVNLIQGNVLNLTISTYDYTGGAHGMPREISYILNLVSGTQYSMRDMIRPNVNYLDAISNIVRAQDTQKTLDAFQPFSGVKASDGFRLRNDGFTI